MLVVPGAAPVARPPGEGSEAPALAVGVADGRDAAALAAPARLAARVAVVAREALVAPRPAEPFPADARARVLVADLGGRPDHVAVANWDNNDTVPLIIKEHDFSQIFHLKDITTFFFHVNSKIAEDKTHTSDLQSPSRFAYCNTSDSS